MDIFDAIGMKATADELAGTEFAGFLDRAKVLSVAGTIAKMADSPHIGAQHVSEAVQYVRSPFGDCDGYAVITVDTQQTNQEGE